MTTRQTHGDGAALALGLDVGGTATRWCLRDGECVLARGDGPGFSGVQLHTPAGSAEVAERVTALAERVLPAARGLRLGAVVAGVTGVGAGSAALAAMLAQAFAVALPRVLVTSDVMIAHRAAFAPGEGYLVYAGTGSIAAFIDADQVLHRAGGRGVLLDDAGGGYWMAHEALRRIWRREDENPGAWRASTLACRLFAKIGGDASIDAVHYLMEHERGEVGRLAFDVAACAEEDALARAIMHDAGCELARLGNAMLHRFGPRPLRVAGGAALLHAQIEASFRVQLATPVAVTFAPLDAAATAADWACAMVASA